MTTGPQQLTSRMPYTGQWEAATWLRQMRPVLGGSACKSVLRCRSNAWSYRGRPGAGQPLQGDVEEAAGLR